MNDIKQEAIFEDKEWWEEEWQNMPEFVQKDLTPAKTLYVHFRNLEDIETFAQLIGQTVTELTRSIWFPKLELESITNKRYVDEP